MLRHWLARVLIPAALILGIGLLMTRRPAAVTHDDVPSGERLHKIGLAIDDAINGLGRAPRDVEELTPFLRGHGDPDRLLMCPVDGRPYVILWGVDVRAVGGGTVLAYEQFGSGGVRSVLTAAGVVQMTDVELNEADFPPGYRPPGGR